MPTSIYSVHPSSLMTQRWIAGLKQSTGRSLDEWVALIEKTGPKGSDAKRAWLKSKHGMGTNTAAWFADYVEGRPVETGAPEEYLQAAERYVEEMFSGGKSGLRPIYDKVLKVGLGIGKDVKACPCQTIVPLFRKHVFAQIKPSTQTRIDLGLALGDRKATGRLIDTGGFAKKDRITHRIPLTSLKEINDDVKRWLKIAYDRDA